MTLIVVYLTFSIVDPETHGLIPDKARTGYYVFDKEAGLIISGCFATPKAAFEWKRGEEIKIEQEKENEERHEPNESSFTP